MKRAERLAAIRLRLKGHSIKEISSKLGVAKSSASLWVRDVALSEGQKSRLKKKAHRPEVVEKRRQARLKNEQVKREAVIREAQKSVPRISNDTLWLVGTMLYWAEGGKTKRLVRFSNGDPEMIKIMMMFFRNVCKVPEDKFRGYIHIHHKLDHEVAERYWADVSKIPIRQFFKTYRKPNKSSKGKRTSLPYGVLDIYVLDTRLFYRITGWARGIFSSY